MGYRSEINILVTLPKRVSAQKVIERFTKAWNYKFDTVDTESVNGCVYFRIDWVKWYEGCFKEVDNVMKLINHWEDHYKTGGVHFIRLGENTEDTEEIIVGECEEYLYLERYVELPK